MVTTTRKSPAKINLTLRVVGVRSDGFHEIESLVARVGLYDTVSVTPCQGARFTLECDDPDVPRDERNLTLRAAQRLAEQSGIRDRGAQIALQKRIPAGAGLGGGSSNAATTLMLLNELWDIGLSNGELADIGAQVGSDVPLFLHSPLCIIRGRGERVEDLPQAFEGWVALVLPPIRSSTRDVYAAWDSAASRPPRPAIEDVLQHADRAESLMQHLFNDLEEPALAVYPGLRELSAELRRLARGPVCLTGSGSAFFRCFRKQSRAEALVRRVRDELGLRTEVAFLPTEP